MAAWSASVRRIQLEEGRVKTCEMSVNQLSRTMTEIQELDEI